MAPIDAYNELSYYTIAHQDPAFIHQHIVDAFAAQYADEETKPIKLAFGLMGLYLMLEKGFSGKMVQREHKNIADMNMEKVWPKFPHKKREFAMDVFGVLNTPPGEERDKAIRKWCQAVWDGYADVQEEIRKWIKEELDI